MTRSLTSVLIGLLAPLVLGQPASDGSPQRVFDIDGRPAREGVVTAPWVDSPEPGARVEVPGTPMLRALSGVVGELPARDLARLRRSVVTKTRVPETLSNREPVVSLLLTSPAGTSRVEIERVEHGWILARTADGSVRARLEGGVIDDLLDSWTNTRPDPGKADDHPEPGEVFACPPPLTPSPIRLDETTTGERFAAGGRSPFAEPMTRDLSRERIFARLPAGYRPGRPAGLLVWISPIPHGEPPATLARAADEHGLICLSAENSGNKRPAIDRAQLALDAVAIARARWWIDPERVLVSGMSGGGRMASMMWACFPDVFTGGVGVVGMNSHHLVGIGDGRFWPKTHERARGDVVRILCHVRVQSQEEMEEIERRRKAELERELASARLRHDEGSATAAAQQPEGERGGDQSGQATPETFVRQERKVGRNEPCPCGSGKKYKQCHGKVS